MKYLTLDCMYPNLDSSIESLGKGLVKNQNLKILNLTNNKISTESYKAFWVALKNNKCLEKINVSRTELNDEVCESLSQFLDQQTLKLIDFDISRNQIGD